MYFTRILSKAYVYDWKSSFSAILSLCDVNRVGIYKQRKTRMIAFLQDTIGGCVVRLGALALVKEGGALLVYCHAAQTGNHNLVKKKAFCSPKY